MRAIVRSSLLAASVGGLLLVTYAGGWIGGEGSSSAGPADQLSGDEAAASRSTAAATVVDLVEEESVAGQLGFGATTPISAPEAGGVITRLPAIADTLRRGDSAWDVDGHAGPAVMYGQLPMWRRLDRNSDDGPDIEQLERNLAELGYGAYLTIDEEFDSATRSVVRTWQDSRGLKPTGAVEVGDVVVLDGESRVAALNARLGGEASGEVLSVTGVDQVVTADVVIDRLSLFTVGEQVLVELPDGRRVTATVDEIAAQAKTSEDGKVTVMVTAVLAESELSITAAPVDLVVRRVRGEDALVVPVRALLALAEGGYAVEKVVGSATELVAVELGDFGDGVVEITSGEVAAGDLVVVAP